MKNYLVGLFLIFVSTISYSQEDWRLREVIDKSKGIVGYVYYTNAKGTKSGDQKEKVITGLRLVCSTINSSADDPIIAVFWNGGPGGATFQQVEVKVDGRSAEVGQWTQDGTFLYRKLLESRPLIQSLRTGQVISLSWAGTDNVRRTTIFGLRNFNTNLSNFLDQCKIHI
ncbi:MAG TPA: hypothetical protein VIY47_07005 [Ignavibacteriaceae bacterium]